ncbi:MAG TPA: hypothetical protein VFU68_02830 [Terracidiphilus sp.]|nr:hypothetical protein [Terracidiphilus sp.]
MIVSYAACTAFAVAASVAVYLCLRESFARVAGASRSRHLSTMLKRLFPFGLVLPALLGFLTVSYYRSCGPSTYERVITNREYLVQINQEQIASVLGYILFAVVFWNVMGILILKSAQHPRGGPPANKDASAKR